MARKCSLKVYDGKKMLHGTAAINHYISINGGWDKYHEDMVKSITEKVTIEVVPKIYNEIIEEMSRPILKIVK